MDHKRKSLKELDGVIEEILGHAPKEWFESLNKIINEQQKNNENSPNQN